MRDYLFNNDGRELVGREAPGAPAAHGRTPIFFARGNRCQEGARTASWRICLGDDFSAASRLIYSLFQFLFEEVARGHPRGFAMLKFGDFDAALRS